MAWPTWWYNIFGSLSPEQKQEEYNQVYQQVLHAGGSVDQAKAAAAQAISPQVTEDTGSYAAAYWNTLTNNGGAAAIATSQLGDVASGIADTVTSVIEKTAQIAGDAVGNVINGKLLLVIAGVAVIFYFWKK